MSDILPPRIVVDAPPRFRVVTTDLDEPLDARTIVLSPSRAFGDGRHESTRTCLQALAAFAPAPPFRMLDVGSGTGVLAIAAAKLGGSAVGVEIDEAANAHATRDAIRNGVASVVRFGTEWPDGAFDVVVANILREILLAIADRIAERLAKRSLLVLSGLVSTDVPAIVARYAPLVGARPEIFERGPWRTLVFRPGR